LAASFLVHWKIASRHTANQVQNVKFAQELKEAFGRAASKQKKAKAAALVVLELEMKVKIRRLWLQRRRAQSEKAGSLLLSRQLAEVRLTRPCSPYLLGILILVDSKMHSL